MFDELVSVWSAAPPGDVFVGVALGLIYTWLFGYVGAGLTTTVLYSSDSDDRQAGGPHDPYVLHGLAPVEGLIYFGSAAVGRIEFAAVWLALKMALRWKEDGTDDGWRRRKWDRFLLGNGLHLAVGIAGGLGAGLVALGSWATAAIVGAIPLLLFGVVWWNLRIFPRELWRAHRRRQTEPTPGKPRKPER